MRWALLVPTKVVPRKNKAFSVLYEDGKGFFIGIINKFRRD
jgi:hypothetical protein